MPNEVTHMLQELVKLSSSSAPALTLLELKNLIQQILFELSWLHGAGREQDWLNSE